MIPRCRNGYAFPDQIRTAGDGKQREKANRSVQDPFLLFGNREPKEAKGDGDFDGRNTSNNEDGFEISPLEKFFELCRIGEDNGQVSP